MTHHLQWCSFLSGTRKMNLYISLSCTHTHTCTHTYTHRVSMLTSTMLEYLFQSNGSPAAIILSYGQIQTHHIDCPSSPSALDSLVFQLKPLINEKAKNTRARRLQPYPSLTQPPGLTHRPLCLLLSFGNSCAVITECVPRLNSCFFVASKAI